MIDSMASRFAAIVLALTCAGGAWATTVAQIGETKYTSLAAAVEAVPADGTKTTIQMIADETIDGTTGVMIGTAQDIVLDLNGHTVQMAVASADERWLIKNEGSMTVKDSAENGKLFMNATGQNSTTGIRKSVVKNMGSFTVEGGTIEMAYSGTSKEEPTAVMNDASERATSFTVNGGIVVNSANRGTGVFLAVNGTFATTFDMQNGRVEGYGAAVRYYFDDNALTDAKLTFKTSGGTIYGRGMYGVHGMTTSSKDWTGISFEISGGTFDSVGFFNRKHVIAPMQGTVSVSGGTFNGDVYIYGHSLNITDGNFNGAVTLHRVKESLVSASISGGRFKGAFAIAETTNENTVNPYYNSKLISGGIFSIEPSATYIATGYEPAANTDAETKDAYPYTVESLGVAKIERDGQATQYFATLADAFAAANEAGEAVTITMIANEAIDIAGNALVIAASKNVVLDLNGFQVVGFCSTGENSALILNNGTLTIVDSSDENADGTGAGKLAYSASPSWNWSGVDGDYSGSYASNLILNNGTVSVEGGLLEVINPAGTLISASFAIDSAPGGVVNINGGKLTSACCTVIRVRVDNSTQSALNISGGSVVAVSPAQRAIWVQDSNYNGNSTVDISGGLVSGPQTSIQNDSYGSNAKATITGGTFDGYLFTYSELDISDGKFNGGQRGSTVFSVSAYGSKSHISGGVFYGFADFYSTASSRDWSVTGGAFSYGGPYQYASTSEAFVRGGIYDDEQRYIAPGFVLTGNTDPATKDAYPYAVVPAVASITIGDKTTYYADLQTAIADAETGDTVTLLADIELTEYQTIQGGTAKYGIIIDKAITIDGAGHTVTGNSDIARTFAVMNTTGEVTIKNITIKNSVAGAVCVYTYDVASLVLDNATLDTTGCPSGYNQPLTISGSGSVKSDIDVLNGSVVKTNDAATQYYAIIVWTPVDLTIDHSTVKGWACVYMKSGSAGSTVEITDSTLVSAGLSGSSNHFAALVTEADNVTMNVTGTEIDITAASGTYQGIGLPCNKSGVSIELGAGNNVTLSGDMAVIGFNMSQGDVTVSGGTFNKAVSDYYCAEGYIPVAQDSETGLYTVKEGVYRAQIVADGYATLSASISEASDDVYLDMWGFWNMKGMVDASGNECPQYVAITDDTMYRDLAIVSDDGVEAWVSAKYIYDNYLAPGKTYYGYQTYYLNEIAPVVKARYETLADAIAAVPTDGTLTTIQMIADSVEAAETAMTIASTQNVVIDLAGHTVSGTFAESKTAERDFIKNHGTLTVKDSSAAGTGKITMTTADSDNSYGSQNVTIYNEGGTFTLEGGCIENLSGYCAYAIVNSSNSWDQYIVSTFNMTGGSVSCPNGDQALRVYQNCAATQNENYTCQNYVNISGGTIVDTGIWLDGFLYTTGWDLTSYTGENIKTVVDISGGTINGLFDYSVRHPYNTEVKISGGTFTECRIRVRTDYTDGLEDDASPAFAISGGEFAFAANGGLTLGSGTAHHNVPYLLTGGYYTSEPAAGYVASGYGVYDGITGYPYAVLPEHPVVVADQTTAISATTLALTGAGDATKFRLDEISSDGKDRTKGAEQQDVSSFSVDLENEMNSATVKYYQIVAIKETTSSTEEDTSSAVIGVMKIENAGKNVIIPIPWASLSSGGEISVANLVRTATLTEGDTIEAYDAGTYKAWTLGSDGQWTPTSVVSEEEGLDEGKAASAFTVPRGAAVWLTRSDASKPIYLVGAVGSGSVSTSLEAGTTAKPSWNLVGNPTASDVKVSDVGGNNTADKIVVPTSTVPKTYSFNEEKNSWGYWTTEEVKIGSITAVKSVWKSDDIDIPAGTGFWYLNAGGEKNLWAGIKDGVNLDDAPTTDDTTGNL